MPTRCEEHGTQEFILRDLHMSPSFCTNFRFESDRREAAVIFHSHTNRLAVASSFMETRRVSEDRAGRASLTRPVGTPGRPNLAVQIYTAPDAFSLQPESTPALRQCEFLKNQTSNPTERAKHFAGLEDHLVRRIYGF